MKFMVKILGNGYYVLPIGKLTDKRFKDGALVEKLKERLNSDYQLCGHIGHPDYIASFFGQTLPDLVVNNYIEETNECYIKMIDNRSINPETLKHCYMSPVITYKYGTNGCEIDRIISLDVVFDHALVNREIQV